MESLKTDKKSLEEEIQTQSKALKELNEQIELMEKQLKEVSNA